MSLILLSVMALMLDMKLTNFVNNKSLLKLLQSNLVKDRTKIDSLLLGARFLLIKAKLGVTLVGLSMRFTVQLELSIFK